MFAGMAGQRVSASFSRSSRVWKAERRSTFAFSRRASAAARLQREAHDEPGDEREKPGGERKGERLVALHPLLHLRPGAGLVGGDDAVLEERREIRRHLGHVAVAPLPVAGHRLLADRHQLRRGLAGEGRDLRGRPLLDAAPDGVVVEARVERNVRHVSGEEVVEHRADRVDVRVRADLLELPRRLFGRHVGGGADDVPVHRAKRRVRGLPAALVAIASQLRRLDREFRLKTDVLPVRHPLDPREPPVHHVHFAEFAHHDVRGLEVAMDDALVVRVGHRLAHLEQDAQGLHLRPAFLPGGDEIEYLLEGTALHELHREVDAARRVEPELVDRHDAGMVELARHLRLLDEARDLRDLGLREDHLHREVPAQILVPDLEDRPHPAAGDLPLQLVAPEGGRPPGEPRDQRCGEIRIPVGLLLLRVQGNLGIDGFTVGCPEFRGERIRRVGRGLGRIHGGIVAPPDRGCAVRRNLLASTA